MRILLLPFLLSCYFCFSQELVSTFYDIEILGTTVLQNNVIIVSSDGKTVFLKSIEASGEERWSNYFETKNLSGYKFNRLTIVGNDSKVYAIEYLKGKRIIHSYDGLSGKEVETRSYSTDLSFKQFYVDQNTLYGFKIENNQLIRKKLEITSAEAEVLQTYSDPNFGHRTNISSIIDGKIYLTSRVLEPNHGLMHLQLQSFDIRTKQVLEQDYDVKLEASSFTYNSTVDREVIGTMATTTGIYLYGKLDNPFKRKYPKQKPGEDFTGFWIGKWDKDLNLIFFREYPFNDLYGLVNRNHIAKPTILQIKEASMGETIVCLHELAGLVYSNKYFIYLSENGSILSAKGVIDEYHFFEYSNTGLRSAGKKTNMRLMNDDWRSIASEFYLYANMKKPYNEDTKSLLSIANMAKKIPLSKKAYTTLNTGEGLLFIEYTNKKGGRLKVYK